MPPTCISSKPTNLNVIASLFLLITLTGCTENTSPPGPNNHTGTVAAAGYSLHRWDRGLTVLVFHDAPASSFCEGTGSSLKTEYVLGCQARSESGIEYAWEIRTENGEEATIRIGTEQISISDDVLFLLRKENGSTRLQRLDRDLSSLEFEHEAVSQFAEIDSALQAFITSLR